MTPAAAPRHWHNRTLVRETDRRRVRSLWRALLVLTIALAPTVVYLVAQNECLGVLYEVSGLRAEHERLETQEQALRVERARLESLAAIEAWATGARGLVRPAADRVLVLPGGPTGSRDLRAGSGEAADRPRALLAEGAAVAAWVGHERH